MSGSTLAPDVIVEIDEARMKPALELALASVYVRQVASTPTLCTLEFQHSGPEPFELDTRPGARLRLQPMDPDVALFDGFVVAVEFDYTPSGARRAHVRAYDRLFLLRKRGRTQRHVDVTLADLLTELTQDIGLTVSAEAGRLMIRDLIQHAQSDLELVQHVAARSGCHFFARERELLVFEPAGTGREVELVLGKQLLEANVEWNAVEDWAAVEVHGWDPLLAAAPHARCSHADLESVGARASWPAVRGEVRTLGNRTLDDEAHAEVFAASVSARQASSRAVVRGTAEGDPRLHPGTPIHVRGIEPDLCGGYVVTRTEHVLDPRSGYTTRFSTEPLAPPTPAAGSRVTLGCVSQIDDPEQQGRVRATLPAFGEVETGWLPVVSPAAGPGKGLVALPEVGDAVAIMIPEDDPARGLVLGGVFVPKGPDDPGVEGGRIRRYSLHTRGGQKLGFDDDAESLTVETSDGSRARFAPGQVAFSNRAGAELVLNDKEIRIANADDSRFELTPSGVALFSSRALEISAPGRPIVIRAKSIDFEEG